MEIIKGKFAEAKVFTDDMEDYARAQLKMICDDPVSERSTIRVMPDVHPGKVGTIGLTMTVGERIIPHLLGIDIGCGMSCAVRTKRRWALERLAVGIILLKWIRTRLVNCISSSIPAAGVSVRK